MSLVKLDWTFLFTIINIIVLYWIMKKVLFKPVSGFIEARAKGIESDIDHAKKMLNDAEKEKEKYAKLLKEAHGLADEIVQRAKDDAHVEYERIIMQGHKEYEILVNRANETIALQKQKAIKEMKDEITSLAFAAASRVVKQNMDNGVNKKIISDFLNEEGVA